MSGGKFRHYRSSIEWLRDDLDLLSTNDIAKDRAVRLIASLVGRPATAVAADISAGQKRRERVLAAVRSSYRQASMPPSVDVVARTLGENWSWTANALRELAHTKDVVITRRRGRGPIRVQLSETKEEHHEREQDRPA